MICAHMDPATADPCCLYFLHNARHRAADGHEWGQRGPHDMPATRETDALWRAQRLAALREPQGEAVRLFEPAPTQIPGQTVMADRAPHIVAVLNGKRQHGPAPEGERWWYGAAEHDGRKNPADLMRSRAL